jgi:hypothetical protein
VEVVEVSPWEWLEEGLGSDLEALGRRCRPRVGLKRAWKGTWGGRSVVRATTGSTPRDIYKWVWVRFFNFTNTKKKKENNLRKILLFFIFWKWTWWWIFFGFWYRFKWWNCRAQWKFFYFYLET